MKSLEELAAIRDKMQNVVNLRSEASDCTRIVVGMATCGIAAGARPVQVITPGKEKVTYVNMTSEKAVEVIEQHIIGGNVVTKYTINSAM